MFSELEINPFLHKERIVERPQQKNDTTGAFGFPEWQQPFLSTHRALFTPKDYLQSKVILDKEYLKPGFSHIKLNLNPKEQTYLTTNRRDHKYIKMNKEDRVFLSKEKIDFIRNSKITFGNDPRVKNSIYNSLMINPSNMTPRYDYDKIKFHYDEYNIHPITGIPVWKNPKKMLPFDYFNLNKDKHYIAARNISYINSDYKKVWDPITNRYFVGTTRNLSTAN